MKIVYFGNNHLGLQLLRWLKERGEEIVGLVLHPVTTAKFADEMRAAVDLPPERIFSGERLREPEVVARIAALEAELGLSIMFGHLLRPELLGHFPRGVVNLHPALLPYNRGQYPNVWSIVEGTPSGTTLHYIDPGLDTGDIIAQKEVREEPTDTGETLYGRLMEASFSLFCETWPQLRAGAAPRSPQPEGGTFHRTRDVQQIDEIDLDRTYTARDLLNLLRARTFPPYRGAWFQTPQGRVFVSVQLELEAADRTG